MLANHPENLSEESCNGLAHPDLRSGGSDDRGVYPPAGPESEGLLQCEDTTHQASGLSLTPSAGVFREVPGVSSNNS